ncbi:MAG TPA: hypothetical protein VFP98_06665 [Candidatus Polarisedimenticolia bacterium]|nr:hypothetical protein [Candidatus Polarisedimenticolia bacterium]
MRKATRSIALGMLVLAAAGSQATAGGHTWRIKELFSNADGTIQFIEVWESLGGAGEVNTQGHNIVSNTHSVAVNGPVASPTSFRRLLFGTPAFQALPGAPPVDQTIVANFFNPNGDTITYTALDVQSFGPGVLPTDGIRSLNRDGTTGVNSPENYAQEVGSVDASPQPAGVPDGTGGSTPMTVESLDAAGSSLSVSWDAAACSGGGEHRIIFGQGSHLPAGAGESFSVMGAVCGIGSTSPYVWNSTPVASDGSGLIWWVIVRGSGANEGSWGKDGDGVERKGSGAGGSSGACAATTQSLSNTCGH